MIELAGEPSLGSLILTRDGVLRYTYILPRGMSFPDDAEGELVFTDRAGGVYEFSPYAGELSEDMTKMTWLVDPQSHNHVPAGSNFEVFVSFDDHTYKVRYGRVVRKEVSYPLNPLSVEQPALMYEDDLQRNMAGPHWVTKAGAMSMHPVSGVTDLTGGTGYAIGPRNVVDIFGAGLSLFASSAALWYAPTHSDAIEISVGVKDVGDGDVTVVFGSNYAMTDFVGVRILDSGVQLTSGLNVIVNPADTIQVVTGTGWNTVSTVGSGVTYDTPNSGGKYTITYSPTAGVKVFAPGGTTPILSRSVSGAGVKSGPGYRYTGLIFHGSLVTTGPVVYYWKVKDAV